MKTLVSMAVAATVSLAAFGAEETQTSGESQAPQKLMLRISWVETPDTRSEKSWTPPKIPETAKKLPYTPEQIQNAKPESAAEMKRANEAQERANFEVQQKIAIQNWKESAEFMKGVRTKLQGTDYGRQVMLAIDKFSGHASSCFNSECIEFFHRLDNIEGMEEAKFTTGSGPQVYGGMYFIKLVFDAPQSKTHSTTVGGGEMSRTFFTQRLTYTVQDNGGKVACSGNVKKETAVVAATAEEYSEARVELMDQCLAEAAKQINDKFVATVIFKAISTVKNDEDFNEDAVSLEVDGVARQCGEEVALLTLNSHKVEATLDGYKQKGSTKMNFAKSTTTKIQMTPTTCNLTVTVKGPAGFDASSATIELVASGEDGNSESLTSGEASKVPQGKYTLKVSAEGCETSSKPLTLAKDKHALTVTLKAAAAPKETSEDAN